MIEIALAFAAGLLTAAAPCILPLLPVLLGASIGRQGPMAAALSSWPVSS
jgi:cytochrome c biogenesis protein CcdA